MERVIATIGGNPVTLRVHANLCLRATWVRSELRKQFGHQVPDHLERDADWQVLLQFPHGELAYDYEEGIRFSWDPDHLDTLLTFVRMFLRKHNLPLVDDKPNERGERPVGAVFTCQLNAMGGNIPKLEDVFLSHGLVRSKQFNFVWELRV